MVESKEETTLARRVDRVAKELAWKASRAERPRGFESHVVRQDTKTTPRGSFLYLCNGNGTRTREGESVVRTSGGRSSSERSSATEWGARETSVSEANVSPMPSALKEPPFICQSRMPSRCPNIYIMLLLCSRKERQILYVIQVFTKKAQL